MTYVGSVDSESYDQVLDSILVGPIPKGVNRFVFEAPCPDHTKLPKKDVLGVTVVFLSCLFQEKEFLRVGYYVNNEYDDPSAIYPEKKAVEALGDDEEKLKNGESDKQLVGDEVEIVDLVENESEDEKGDNDEEEEEEEVRQEGGEGDGDGDGDGEDSFIQNDANNQEAAAKKGPETFETAELLEQPKKKQKMSSTSVEGTEDSDNKENQSTNSSVSVASQIEKTSSAVEKTGDPISLSTSKLGAISEADLEKKHIEEVPLPLNFDITKVKRHIFADQPRITRIQIT